MKKTPFLILLVFAVLLLAVPAFAQTPTTSANKLGWDQSAADLATAQAATYTAYADGGTTGAVVASVTCAGTTSPYQCLAPFPAFTPGTHSLTLTAKNIAGESAKSAPLVFTFVVVLGAPMNVGIR